MEDELSLKISGELTGREGLHWRANKPTEHVEIQEFISSICHPTNVDWRRVLAMETARRTHQNFEAAISRGLRGTYFRARRFSADARPGAEEFGAPPAGRQAAGRYNEIGNRVLYLSRSLRTAVLECRAEPANPNVFVQKFGVDLPMKSMIALELRMEATHPYLHYLLLDSEYVPMPEADALKAYRATHFLAYLCRLHDVSGIEYPSVAGDFKNHPDAVNLVVLGEAVAQVERMTEGSPLAGGCDYPTYPILD